MVILVKTVLKSLLTLMLIYYVRPRPKKLLTLPCMSDNVLPTIFFTIFSLKKSMNNFKQHYE